jgi:hypothetical protein
MMTTAESVVYDWHCVAVETAAGKLEQASKDYKARATRVSQLGLGRV